MNDLDKHNEENETSETLAPTLFAMSKKNSFNVPEGYFETLPHIIQDKCIAATRKKSMWEGVCIYILRQQLLLAAVCLCLVFFFSLQYYKKQNIAVAKDDAVTAIYINELDEQTLEENIVSNKITPNVDATAVTEYLLDQNIDPSQYNN